MNLKLPNEEEYILSDIKFSTHGQQILDRKEELLWDLNETEYLFRTLLSCRPLEEEMELFRGYNEDLPIWEKMFSEYGDYDSDEDDNDSGIDEGNLQNDELQNDSSGDNSDLVRPPNFDLEQSDNDSPILANSPSQNDISRHDVDGDALPL